MKFLKAALAATALTAFATSAQAQDTGAYINLGVDAVEFDAYSLAARAGYQFTENFSVEGQGSFGIIDDEVQSIDVGVDYSVAAFVRGSIPVGEQFSLFARGGYHFTQFGAEGNGIDDSLDFDGFAYGVGGEYMINDLNGIRADITLYDSSDDNINGVDVSGTSDVYSIAYVRKF